MDFLIVLAVVAVVAVVVTAPLRARGRAAASTSDAADIADLEAARDAKYREIRDAELDHRTGKLSDADYEAIDGSLRAEAVEILRALDGARERSEPGGSKMPVQ
jgi:hypothetical protein